MCRIASCFNGVNELKQKMLILLEFVTNLFFHFDNRSEFLINRSLQVECHLKQRK
jgi:hypothetical protein